MIKRKRERTRWGVRQSKKKWGCGKEQGSRINKKTRGRKMGSVRKRKTAVDKETRQREIQLDQ